MKKIVKILLCVLLLIALCVGLFHYFHPTHYRFNDRFVLGSTKEEIIARYAAPYSGDENTLAYQIRDNTPELFMSYDDSLWYVIVFENGVAAKVYLREGRPGG